MVKIRTPKELQSVFIRHAHKLPYAKLRSKEKYKGWVSDFGITFKDGQKMALELKQENDRFLLFVLAVVWSRTGPWENAAYFVTYLKRHGKGRDTAGYWKEKENRDKELTEKRDNAKWIRIEADGSLKARRAISFRKDIFRSIGVLAKKWNDIERETKRLGREKDGNKGCEEFMNYLRKIKGLGVGNKQIFMKIPLILRELRCQGWDSIPGKFCCVVDARARKACEAVGIKLVQNRPDVKVLIENSERVYVQFGDLYDMPLFAYEDLIKITK